MEGATPPPDGSGLTSGTPGFAVGSCWREALMLSFWGTWCPYCRAEIHFATDAYARFQSRGFEIRAVRRTRCCGSEAVDAKAQ